MDDNIKYPKRTKQVDHDAKEREEALITGRLIWEDFKSKFVQTPAKPHDIPGRFIALRDKLVKEVKHPEVLAQMLDMVDAAAIKAYVNFPQSTARRSAPRPAKARRTTKPGRTNPRGPRSELGGSDPTAVGPARN